MHLPNPNLHPRQSNPQNPGNDGKNHPFSGTHASAWGFLALGLFILLVLLFIAWFLYSHLRARRLGLPPPSLIPFRNRNNRIDSGAPRKGPLSWIKTKVSGLRGKKSGGGGGAYESTRGGGAGGLPGRGGRGLDPDEAWDARVGAEADDYEGPYGAGYGEQSVGLATRHARVDSDDVARGNPFGDHAQDTGYHSGGGLGEITESRGRSPRHELEERYAEETGGGKDPFGDHAQLRGVSPRPHDEESGKRDSDRSERRSIFREQM